MHDRFEGKAVEEQEPVLRAAADDMALQRRRTQVLSALFAFVSAASGTLVLQVYGVESVAAAAFMLVVSAACVLVGAYAMRPMSGLARGRVSDLLSVLIVLAYAAPLLFSVWGPPMADDRLSVFRPIFGFTFFVYLGLIMLQPSAAGLRRLWAVYAGQIVVVLGGVYWHGGIASGRDGMAALLLWLVLGNAFFIVLLHSLAFYARALRRLGREAADAQALRVSEESLSMVLHSMQAGAWGWRMDGENSAWTSPRFRELLGWQQDDENAPQEVFHIVHPDEVASFTETIRTELEASRLFDADARLQCRDGSYRWFNVRGHTVFAEDGTVRETVGAILDIDETMRARQALEASHERLAYLAYHDWLTGLYNRRYFLEQFERELSRARRRDEPLSLVIVDIDHFKPYNDSYGHSAGDEALQTVAKALKECARRGVDVAARFGGEEFAILLQNADAQGAMQVARHCCQRLFDAAVPHVRSAEGVLTISVGATTLVPGEQPVTSMDLMIEEADAALYRVKMSGRNHAWHYLDAANEAPAVRAEP